MLLMHYPQDVHLVFATIQGIFLLSHLYFPGASQGNNTSVSMSNC